MDERGMDDYDGERLGFGRYFDKFPSPYCTVLVVYKI